MNETESAARGLRQMGKGLLLMLVVTAVLVGAGWLALHQWYVATHCTMIAGTQICR